jgi:transcriptional regulator with XRE-family HTH domain
MELRHRSNAHVRQELGRRVRELRRSRHLTQAKLADRAGLSRPTVSTFERGNDVSLDSFLSVLRALDLLGALNAAVPEPAVSPIAELNHSPSSPSTRRTSADGSIAWTWGDERADS